MPNIITKIKNTLTMWSWCCAVRFNDNENACILNDKNREFTVVPNSWRYWLADPFLFEKDNQLYIFFEAFDLLKRKGVLGYRTASTSGFGKINICYESKGHLSFPFIYRDNDDIFIIPESAKDNELYKVKCVDFPSKWEKGEVLCSGKMVDTIRAIRNGKELFLTEQVEADGTFDRLDLLYLKDNKLIQGVNNPVKRDSSSARGAGNIFLLDQTEIRPSQDCGSSYGERLNFNRIIEFNENEYKEVLIETISYKDIRLNKNIKIDGIHTYNKLNNVEIIDLRIPGKFNLFYTLGLFYKVFKRIFHK